MLRLCFAVVARVVEVNSEGWLELRSCVAVAGVHERYQAFNLFSGHRAKRLEIVKCFRTLGLLSRQSGGNFGRSFSLRAMHAVSLGHWPIL